MPKLTRAELLSHEKPYDLLFGSKESSFEEYQADIFMLDEEQQYPFAHKIILQCPNEQVQAFSDRLETLAIESDEDFIKYLSQAALIRLQFQQVLDSDSTNAHSHFLSSNFQQDNYNPHHQLTLRLIKGNETTIATNLILHAPANKLRELQRHVRNTFHHTELPSVFANACLMNHLLGKFKQDPLEVLKSRDFNPVLWKQFPTLVEKHLAGAEEAIANTLYSKTTEHDWIKGKLLSIESNDETSDPFRAILVRFLNKVTQEENPNYIDRHRIFAIARSYSASASELQSVIDNDTTDKPSFF